MSHITASNIELLKFAKDNYSFSDFMLLYAKSKKFYYSRFLIFRNVKQSEYYKNYTGCNIIRMIRFKDDSAFKNKT